MNRRSFLQNSMLTAGAFAAGRNQLFAALQQEPWKITMLTDQLGIFSERGGTIAFLLQQKEIVVVDAQFPEQSQHLIEELKKRVPEAWQTNAPPVRLLINTHHHGDHTAGNISFKGIAAHVVAHTNSRINQENVARQNKTETKQLFPDQEYNYIWRQKIGKENIGLYYFGPAHTNGDSYVHFENQKIVHCGDLVFNRRHPYVDRPAGAHLRNWMQVLEKGIDKFGSTTKYIFGHAGTGYEVTGTADDLKAFRAYLGQVLDFVQKQIKEGKTKDEVLKATSIPGADQWKGDGIQRPLTAAWEELTNAS